MQNNENFDKLISEALQNAPPAPELLHRNVMAAIREQSAPRKREMRHVYALASTAVMLLAVFGAYIVKDNLPKAASSDNSAQEIVLYNAHADVGAGEAPQDEAVIDAPSGEADDGSAIEANMFDEAVIAEDMEQTAGAPNETPAQESAQANARLYENALVIRGDLPSELVGLVFTELEEGVYEFTGVTQTVAQRLVLAGAEGELLVSDEGLVRVLWIPEHIEMDE